MLPGFNHNFKRKERIYHIQTEDEGLKRAIIVTHVFLEGTIVDTMKSSYKEHLSERNLKNLVMTVMKEQHRAMARNLVQGMYDDPQAFIQSRMEMLRHSLLSPKGPTSPMTDVVPPPPEEVLPPPEPPARVTTRPPTAKADGVPVRVTTRPPAAKANEAPARVSTTPPAAKADEALARVSTTPPVAKATDAPARVSTTPPAAKATEAPARVSTTPPAAKATEAPVRVSTRPPTVRVAAPSTTAKADEAPARVSTRSPAAESDEAPLRVSTTPPMVEATEAPVRVSTTPPMVEATDAPVRVSTTPPAARATEAPVRVSTTPPAARATEAPVRVSTTPPAAKATEAPVRVSTTPPMVEAGESDKTLRMKLSPLPDADKTLEMDIPSAMMSPELEAKIPESALPEPPDLGHSDALTIRNPSEPVRPPPLSPSWLRQKPETRRTGPVPIVDVDRILMEAMESAGAGEIIDLTEEFELLPELAEVEGPQVRTFWDTGRVRKEQPWEPDVVVRAVRYTKPAAEEERPRGNRTMVNPPSASPQKGIGWEVLEPGTSGLVGGETPIPHHDPSDKNSLVIRRGNDVAVIRGGVKIIGPRHVGGPPASPPRALHREAPEPRKRTAKGLAVRTNPSLARSPGWPPRKKKESGLFSRPSKPASLFGEDMVTQRSLDEVILDFIRKEQDED